MDPYIKEIVNMGKSAFKKDDGSPKEKHLSPTLSGRDGEYETLKEKKKVVKRKTFVKPGFYVKLAKGFYFFIQGSISTLKTEGIQRTYYSMVKTLILSIAAMYLTILCMTYPIKYSLWILSYFGWSFPSIQEILEPRNLFYNVAMFLPLVLIGILRYILPSFNDDMFFHALKKLDPKLSEYLKGSKILKVYPVMAYFKRFGKMALMGLFIYVTSFVPILGNAVFAVSQYYYSYEPLGRFLAFSLALFSLFGQYKPISIVILKTLMASHSLGKELLEPYFARVPSVKHEFYLYRRYFGTVFGFSLCWLLVLTKIPLVGTSLWPIAQGSSAYLILRILERNQWKSDHGEPFILFGQHETTKFKTPTVLN